MKVAIIGASGWLGGTLSREALARGHEVTAVGRDRTKLADLGATGVATADVTDPPSLERAIAGHDAVLSAVTDRTTADRSIIPTTARTLLECLPRAGVRRLLVVGGGGSLEIEPGVREVDRPDFPDAYRAEAEAQAEALAILRGAESDVEWSYLSPPPRQFIDGEGRGGYRVQAGDRAVLDANGESRITSGDFAAAMIDELENPRFVGQRFTAGY